MSRGIRTSSSPDNPVHVGLISWAKRLVVEGRRLEFERFPWLVEIYQDDHPVIVVRKATQLGFTIWALMRQLHGLLYRYYGVLYYMPTDSDVSDFVRARVNPILDENPALRRRTQDTDNIGLKSFGIGHVYFRGMRSRSGMKAVPADSVVLDEVDEASEEATLMIRKRLAASPYQHEIQLSNPTFPDYGVDRLFQRSDKRAWHLRCSHCSKWACPDWQFPREMGREVPCIGRTTDGRHFLRCEHCSGELNPAADKGRWVPMQGNGHDRPHGYWLSQICRPGARLADLLDEYRTTTRTGLFYNLTMGLPWVDATNRVTKDQVLELCGDWPIPESDEGPCTMGIDSGQTFHWQVSRWNNPLTRKRRRVWMGVASGYEELTAIQQRYNVRRTIIDALPEIHSTKKWAQGGAQGQVFRCFFSDHQKGGPAWDEHPDELKVTVNRTEALDVSRDVVRDRTLMLPRHDELVELYATHYQNDAKHLVDVEASGTATKKHNRSKLVSRRYQYIKLSREDHWSLASTYDCMLWRMAGDSPAELSVIHGDDKDPLIPGGEGINVMDWKF